MPSTVTRRRVLATTGSLVALPGCLEENRGTGSTERPAPSEGQPVPSEAQPVPLEAQPAPSATLPALDGDTIEVSESFRFDVAGVYGWHIDGSFTRALDLSASVADGTAATVYVTDSKMTDAREPEDTVVTFETAGSVNGVELGGGTGTVLFEATGPTTLTVSLFATSI